MPERCFISLPMRDVSTEDIVRKIEEVAVYLRSQGYEPVNPLINEASPEGISNIALWYLGKSLQNLASCQAIYCCKGYDNARGCMIEYEAAKRYGLNILVEN